MNIIKNYYQSNKTKYIQMTTGDQADLLFLDIETTGLSAQKHFIYCIGTAYYESEDQICVTLFFANNESEEPEILQAFTEQLRSFSTILTFNGDTFDLPFIKNRIHDPNLFSEKRSIDLFKVVRSMKQLFQLENYKQKTVEQFLQIDREDLYSGKELLDIYKKYSVCQDPQLYHLLITHNLEDVLGMTKLLSIFAYRQLSNGSFAIEKSELHTFTDFHGTAQTEYEIHLGFEHPFPASVTLHQDESTLLLRESKAILTVHVSSGEKKHYIKDWKSHMYLTEEHMVVHKSVAMFMEKHFYRKACAEECFVTADGLFLPVYCKEKNWTGPMIDLFKNEYKDKQFYIRIEDCDNTVLYHYVTQLIHNLYSIR